MRRRASRAAIFAAVVAGHLLALHFFPDFRPPPEPSDRDIPVAITFLPTQPRPQQSQRAVQTERSRISQTQAPATPGRRSKRTSGERKQEPVSPAVRQANPRAIQPWIDWDRQADAAIADRTERAAEAARRASALSRWREHVMPAPWVPHGPEFRWDYAATHRFQSTPGGLIINISDRCGIVTNGLFVLPFCRIGKIPAYGDLFAHMDDPKPPADFSVP